MSLHRREKCSVTDLKSVIGRSSSTNLLECYLRIDGHDVSNEKD